MLHEQPKEKEAPQVSGSSPWQAHVLLRNQSTKFKTMGSTIYTSISYVGMCIYQMILERTLIGYDHTQNKNSSSDLKTQFKNSSSVVELFA
jgi:hypothetical protein